MQLQSLIGQLQYLRKEGDVQTTIQYGDNWYEIASVEVIDVETEEGIIKEVVIVMGDRQ